MDIWTLVTVTGAESARILIAMDEAAWRKCSVCKSEIGHSTTYYVCSVSTCNAQRTNFVFCSVPCFERHLPGARHRDAGAIEKTSPPSSGPRRVIATAPAIVGSNVTSNVASSMSPSGATRQSSAIPNEILVVVSKVKDYIRARSEMNTSDAIMVLLSDRIRELCDEAIESARQEGRKTVLDRDLKRR